MRTLRMWGAAAALFLLAGCAPAEAPPAQQTPAPGTPASITASAAPEAGEGTLCERDFGSYTVPEGWLESDVYSTDDKLFYVPEEQAEAELPDNISVEEGSNGYAPEEHEQFRDAILSQLMMQLRMTGDTGAALLGDGTYTDSGDILYVFTVEGSDGVITKQFYVVGDHRYCLIHLTRFSGSGEADEAASRMAASFQWSD